MELEWEQVIVNSRDPHALGHWWAGVLGWVVVEELDESVEIRPEPDRMPGLLFGRVEDPASLERSGPSRLHLDFRPADQGAAVEAFLAAGATPTDVGQGDVPWVVLADPEGNEFCVLSPRSAG
jgi:catechol 2,3-dioxygenase-like lactoylglutathione lyase family enzyme